DDEIAGLRGEVATLKEQSAALEKELLDTRLALAKMARVPKSDISQKSTFVAPDEKSTFQGSEKSTSETVTSAKYQRLKEHLEAAILRGEKVNLRKISTAADVSYNMARRHAQGIIDALLQER